MQIEGLSVVMDTKAAQQSAAAFQATIDRLAGSLERYGEGQKAADTVVERSPRKVRSARDAFLDLGQGVDELRKKSPQAATSMRAIAAEADRAGSRARASGRGLRQFGSEAGAAGSVFGQLLSTLGGSSQAAQSVSLLASSSSSLLGAVSPLTLVTTAAGAAIAAFAVDALTAESATEKLAGQALKAQQEFTNLRTAVENAGGAFSKVGEARGRNTQLENEADELEYLLELQKALGEAAQQIERDRQRVVRDDPFGGFDLNVEQIKELGELLGKRGGFFQNLEIAASDLGESSERALQSLREEVGLRKENDLIVLDSVKAQKLLAEQYRTVEETIRSKEAALRSQQAVESEQDFRGILNALERRIELEKLGSAERAAATLVAERQAELGRELSAVEQDLADRIVATGRAEDERTEAAKRMATQAAEQVRIAAEREALERAQASRQEAAQARFRDLLNDTERQIALLNEEGSARDALAKRLVLEQAAREALGEVTEQTSGIIDRLVDRYETAVELEKQRGQGIKETTEAVHEHNRAKEELLERLQQERELLSLTGEARERYRTEIAAEREGRQAGLTPDELENYKKARVELEQLNAEQERAAELGEQLGQSIGGALERIIFDGADAKDVIKDLLQEMSRNAFRQTVTNNIQQLLGSALGSISFGGGGGGMSWGGGATGSYVSGAASVAPIGLMRGGVIPAMSGQIVDQPTFLQRAGRSYSIAEGGRSTPEAVLPLERDARGRLGVGASGGGGGVTLNLNVSGMRSQRDAWAAGQTISQQVAAAMGSVRGGRRGIRP